jgi:hypothetical protein
MTSEIPAKNRRRGGQPGNQNAKGKGGGNRTNRRHRFATGNRLGGAPFGNRNARKRSKLKHQIVLDDYPHSSEAAEWIREHASELDDADFTADDERDRGLFDGYLGLTPEALSANGLEFKLRLYTTMEAGGFEDDDVAA